MKQNRLLNCRKKEKKLQEKVSKFISRKLHKSENDLLLNKTENYRYKKILDKFIENQKPSKLDNNWNFNLRKQEGDSESNIMFYKTSRGNDSLGPIYGIEIIKNKNNKNQKNQNNLNNNENNYDKDKDNEISINCFEIKKNK